MIVELALHVGDDVHDVKITLDTVPLGHLDATGLGDAAHIVAAQVEQHQMLGQFLRIVEQFIG